MRRDADKPLFKDVVDGTASHREELEKTVTSALAENWTWSRTAALIITSILFGLIHLGFRGFPNWRWALVASILGWCCGRARNQAGTRIPAGAWLPWMQPFSTRGTRPHLRRDQSSTSGPWMSMRLWAGAGPAPTSWPRSCDRGRCGSLTA